MNFHLLNDSFISFFSTYSLLKSQHISGLFVYNPCHKIVAFISGCKSDVIAYWQYYSSPRKSVSSQLHIFSGNTTSSLYYDPWPNARTEKAMSSTVCLPLGYLMLMFLRARFVRIRGNARVRGAFPGCIQLPEVFRLDDQFTARHRPYTDNRDKNLIIPA